MRRGRRCCRRHLSFHDRDGGYELRGWLDREAAEIVRSALRPLAAPRPATETEVDLRDAAQRDADALVELAQRALGSGELPTEGGQRPQVVVTVNLPVLVRRIGSASLAWGGPINAKIARRIACDAQIIPVVLGARGEPLDVGRASHTVCSTILTGGSRWSAVFQSFTHHPGSADPHAATHCTPHPI